MADLSLQWFAPAILALVPALVRLRRGQTLARYLDDPAFPERLLGSRTLLTAAFAFAVAIEIVLWPRQTWWSLPLLLLSLVAAGWPLRRAMFAETWSVGTYVLFYVRLVVAIYGFWIVLMAAPWLTRFDGPPWIAPLLLGAVLVIWNEQHTVVLKWIFRARPVTAASLLERCRTIVARSNIVPPKIDYVDMKGGVFANAVALPDTATPSVLFTSSLLERLDEDEAVAIFAHEVAHLEHFNPRYLRKLRAAGWAIVMAAVTIGPLLHYYAPRFESFVWAWPFVVFAYTSILTVHRQKHETESDARAVALTGDAEALVRGLAKLHALGKVPRRLDPNVEVHLSHPSLARRVQAIRAAAGTAATRLDEPVTLQSGTTVVTLHADRLAWSEADGTSHALPYATLNDLRIEAGGGGAATLSAADTHGRRWTLSLAETDVARTQAALDVIDVRLRPAPSGVGVWR
ncbi:MAG TPA: M48 family metalloprotease, partial [Vicinamibacterales bacterium]|nr:M48 family metalloprotease [Vicinamibacterales bacterium]